MAPFFKGFAERTGLSRHAAFDRRSTAGRTHAVLHQNPAPRAGAIAHQADGQAGTPAQTRDIQKAQSIQWLCLRESRPSFVPLTEWDHLWLTNLVPDASIGIAGGTPNRQNTSLRRPGKRAGTMTAQELLQQISDFCRHAGLAESTFGRRAVNDGKLANRLRNGGRITTETVDRIMAFMNANREAAAGLRPGHRVSRTAAGAGFRRCVRQSCRRLRPIPSAISASSTTGRNTCCS